MTEAGSRLNWILFLLLGGMWGSSYLFIKFGVETIPPLTLVAGRLGIGAVLLVGILIAAREPLPRTARMYGHLTVLAIVSVVLPFSLITWAEQSVESSLAATLNSSIPLFTIVIAALALRDEPITINRLAGLAIGFLGVLVLTSRGLTGAIGDPLAELALVGASVSYAAGAVYARRHVTGLRPMVPATFQVGIAFLISAGLALVFERPFTLTPTAGAVGSVAWLGIVGSGLAYLTFFRLLRSWGATRTSMVAYVLPVVGIALGGIFAHETIDARVVIGAVLVIGGIGLVNGRFGQRQLFGRSARLRGRGVAP